MNFFILIMLYFRKGQYLKGRFPWQEMNRPFHKP